MLDRLLVCGSRHWTDRALIRATLAVHPARVMICGAAHGADSIAAEEAVALGSYVALVPAQWERDGRAGGPLRNRAMLLLRPELVLAFWDGSSPGTKDIIAQAEQAKVPVMILSRGEKQTSC